MSTLTVVEGAQVLKIHRKTMEELINSGAIPAAKIGRSWVMMERDVIKYLERQIQNQTAARIGERTKS